MCAGFSPTGLEPNALEFKDKDLRPGLLRGELKLRQNLLDYEVQGYLVQCCRGELDEAGDVKLQINKTVSASGRDRYLRIPIDDLVKPEGNTAIRFPEGQFFDDLQLCRRQSWRSSKNCSCSRMGMF